MREEKWHSARISPDIENLHHHCWDLREERGQDWGGGEGNRTEAERGRGCGVRDRGGRMCPGTGCRETAETEKGREKKARAKAEARFMSPRIPTSFYRPRDDWMRLSGCMATEVFMEAARRWAHCSGDSRLKVAHVHYFRCLKKSVNCISYLSGFGKAFMSWCWCLYYRIKHIG